MTRAGPYQFFFLLEELALAWLLAGSYPSLALAPLSLALAYAQAYIALQVDIKIGLG